MARALPRREPPSFARSAPPRLETLEATRGIAALLVVMYHLQDIFGGRLGILPFGGLFGAGDRGVDLFFVLSGFIIMMTHAADIGTPARTLPYLYKRACRVFPSVWILTALAIVVYANHFGGPDKAAKLEPWNVTASLLLLPQELPALVNVTWTLRYEIFFYALFALLIARPRFGFGLLLAWQAAVALRAVGILRPSNWIMEYYMQPICLEFGIGIVCALLILRARRGWLGNRLVQLGLLLIGATAFVGSLAYEGLMGNHPLEPVRLLAYGLAPGALILALALLEGDRRLRVPGPLVWLGGTSYALYLVNFSVIALAAAALLRLHMSLPPLVMLLGCAVLAITAGGAFHVWVDRPIQRQLRRFGRTLFEPGHRRGVADPGALPQAGGLPR